MKSISVVAFCTAISFMACTKPVTKKVIVMGRGKIEAKADNITMNDGSGHTEETVELRGDEETTLSVTTPSGKTRIQIPKEEGLYILNLKSDTLVGSQQIIGKDISSGRTITQEELKVKIDSLTKLTKGQNASTAAHTYFIVPNKLEKISANMDAKVFGPFSKISSSIETDKNGKEPEIYKFYTNKEMRGLIKNFQEMTY